MIKKVIWSFALLLFSSFGTTSCSGAAFVDRTYSASAGRSDYASGRAVVKAKKYVRYDEGIHVYRGEDGDVFRRDKGDEEWRVYFQIMEFRDVSAAVTELFLQSERERARTGNLRFRFKDRAWFESLRVGDCLEVIIDPHDNGTFTVVSVRRLDE